MRRAETACRKSPRRGGRTRAVAGRLAALTIAWAAASGCGEDSVARSIRLTLRPDHAVPEEVSAVELLITASRTEGGNTCVSKFEARVLPTDDSPYVIDFMAGDVYDVWLAVRVTWLLGGIEVGRREKMISWPSSGRKDEEIVLGPECYRRACGDTEQCIDGTCVRLADPGPFSPELLDVPYACCDLRADWCDPGLPDAGDGGAE